MPFSGITLHRQCLIQAIFAQSDVSWDCPRWIWYPLHQEFLFVPENPTSPLALQFLNLCPLVLHKLRSLLNCMQHSPTYPLPQNLPTHFTIWFLGRKSVATCMIATSFSAFREHVRKFQICAGVCICSCWCCCFCRSFWSHPCHTCFAELYAWVNWTKIFRYK